MGVKTDERRFEPGFVALVTQLNKAIHRRSSVELLGMRLKPYMTLGYIRDRPCVACSRGSSTVCSNRRPKPEPDPLAPREGGDDVDQQDDKDHGHVDVDAWALEEPSPRVGRGPDT